MTPKISFPKNNTERTKQCNAEFYADYKCAEMGFKMSKKKVRDENYENFKLS
jgi:hypothetical protein